jgi:hypothetical protein
LEVVAIRLRINDVSTEIGMKAQSLALLGLLLALSSSVVFAADSAPSALFGKTVVLSWTENRTQRSDAGAIKNSTTASDFRVYISNAGRLFSRFTRKNTRSGRSNSSAMTPDGNAQFGGVGQGSRTAHFEGRQFISENQMKSGARRIQADFDSSYRSCALRVIYGKEDGAPLHHRAMDGRMYYIVSTDVISPKCAIEDGNQVGTD